MKKPDNNKNLIAFATHSPLSGAKHITNRSLHRTISATLEFGFVNYEFRIMNFGL